MRFKRNKKQKKTSVYSKCTDFPFLLGDLFGKEECSTDYYTFFISPKMYVFMSLL